MALHQKELFLDINGNKLSVSDNNQVAELLLEYVMCLAAEWYELDKKRIYPDYRINGQDCWDLRAKVMLLYPFHFATANGHSIALFEALGEFIWNESGIESNILKRKLNRKEEFNWFDLNYSKLSLKRSHTIAEIKDEIGDSKIDIKDNSPIKLSEIYVQKNDKTKNTAILTAIDDSRNALFTQTRNFLQLISLEYEKVADEMKKRVKIDEWKNSKTVDYEIIKGKTPFIELLP